LHQTYSNYEVIIVDDASSDGSWEYLQTIQHPKLSVHRFQKKIAGKKEVLHFGIQQAAYDWILVCDADCRPASAQWIESMSCKLIDSATEIVLGVAPYIETASKINLWSRYENFMTAVFYLSMALSKHAYMGVGRNMLFKKELYLDVFEKIIAINTLSGDDDLFVNAASSRMNTRINIDKNSFVYSASKVSFQAFITQKTRHISTGYQYKIIDKIILAAYPISFLFLLITYIWILFFIPAVLISASILFLGYLTSSMLVKTYCAEKLHFRSKIPVFILDILYLCYQIMIHPLYLSNKNKSW
jgi:cellulose synthase/poly-beta-1,6-N-acetylglucosamine synthase-like glycosyltransferase